MGLFEFHSDSKFHSEKVLFMHLSTRFNCPLNPSKLCEIINNYYLISDNYFTVMKNWCTILQYNLLSKFNLFIRKNKLFGIVFTDQTFSIEDKSYGRLKEKINLRGVITFLGLLIAAHLSNMIAWFRILNTNWSDPQSSLSDIFSIELNTETAFVNLNSIY